MSAATLERIRGHLVSLKMPRALEALDDLVQKLERGELSALDAIEVLLAEERTLREGRRIKVALQMANLTPVKSLDSFDFTFQPSLDRQRILALAQLDFIERCEAVRVRCGYPTFREAARLRHSPPSWFTGREEIDGQDARGPAAVLA